MGANIPRVCDDDDDDDDGGAVSMRVNTVPAHCHGDRVATFQLDVNIPASILMLFAPHVAAERQHFTRTL